MTNKFVSFVFPLSFCNTSKHYIANSLVGIIINTLEKLWNSWVENIYKIGRRNEAVLPLPVTAFAITSFLCNIKGMANCYIGVG
jgi:hypothetical protein